MRKQKKIGFIGVKKQDLCIYLAAILNNLGYQVLVEDRSYEQEILNCIPDAAQGKGKFFYHENEPGSELSLVGEHLESHYEKKTYKNVDYIGETCELCEEYDYHLIDLGEWAQSLELKNLDEIILVTDCEKRNIEKYRKLFQIFSVPMSLVVRNICEFHKRNLFLQDYFHDVKWNLTERFLLPFDAVDEEYRICMQYEPYREFNRISEELNSLLIRLCKNNTENKLSQILYALKQARKGKCIR